MKKKKAFLFLLALGTMLALASCGSNGGGKKCGGDTCPIGYVIQPQIPTK